MMQSKYSSLWIRSNGIYIYSFIPDKIIIARETVKVNLIYWRVKEILNIYLLLQSEIYRKIGGERLLIGLNWERKRFEGGAGNKSTFSEESPLLASLITLRGITVTRRFWPMSVAPSAGRG